MISGPQKYRLARDVRTRTVIDGAPEKKPHLLKWALDMVIGHGDEADFPEVSGFAPLNSKELLAVRDTKSFHFGTSVVGTVSKESGTYSPLEMDWSATGRPFDLEAITPDPSGEGYLAVEGSRSLGRTPRLLQMEVTPEGGRSTAAYDLPQLDQEIEGMVARGNTVLLAGRGEGPEASKLYWGNLSEQGLTFSAAGQAGIEVRGPEISEKQRDVTELVADQDGVLWASSTATVGSVGEYRSAVYQLGNLCQGEQPFELNPGAAFFVDGPKVEALHIEQNRAYLGSDNESLKGRLDLAEGLPTK